MSRTPFEVFVVPTADFHLSRPDFLSELHGGLFVVLAEVPKAENSDAEAENEESGSRPRGWNRDFGRETGAWLHIGEDETITAFTGKVEVGQDIRTSLAQIVAEELCVPPSAVQLVMGDTDLTPFDMGTFGSRTTPFTVPHFRHVAATARELMLDLAAQAANTPRESLSVGRGCVTSGAMGRSWSFGELTRHQIGAQKLRSDAATKSPADWEITGKIVPKVSARAMVTGAHRYASDLTRPGLMWAKILRPTAFGAELQSLDDTGAHAIPGVVVVREGDFVGVVAPHPELAERGLLALQAQWTQPDHAPGSEIHDFRRDFDQVPSDAVQGARNSEPWIQGSLSSGFDAADCVVEASYRIAFIAHAPLEPRAALAEWDGDGPNARLTVWTGTQRPFGVRDELAEALSISSSLVRVIVPDTGSGYGGKHTGEAALEAARLSRVVNAPVKLLWTREEEFTWAYNRPGGLIEIKAGASREGILTAWEFHNINSGSSGLSTPYDVPNQHLEFHPAPSPLRQGSYRALASTANHFARECLMDEIAHQLGLDPLQFRLQNLSNPRMRAVLEAAAQGFGWNIIPAAGHGFGLAVGTEKAGFVATVAEVSVQEGQIKVERLVIAFECGAIINPANLKSQIEGALIQGLGGALFEAVEWSAGRIQSNCFSRYRVPRFSDMPKLETILLNRPDLASEGAGESPLIAVAPAIGNALFAATGVRRRVMPLSHHR